MESCNRQAFGEQVCQVVICCAVLNPHLIRDDLLLHKMVLDVDMLGTGVIDQVD